MRKITFLPVLWIILIPTAGCDVNTPTPAARPLTAATEPAAEPTGTVTPGWPCIRAAAGREEAVVTGVTDGDSIEVEAGGVTFRVRYIGMDAPEMNGEPLGEEARAANFAMVGGKTVIMIRDLSEADRYGRLLRHVFADGVFINRELVRIGLAHAGSYPPDISCYEDFKAAEEEARLEALGIWGLLGSPTYSTHEGGSCVGGCATPPAGCVIKGNINSKGDKIYHMPGGKYYEATVIEPEKGERWFCSEAEAVAAGWRRSDV
jgi:micrococcal nuclease